MLSYSKLSLLVFPLSLLGLYVSLLLGTYLQPQSSLQPRDDTCEPGSTRAENMWITWLDQLEREI